MVVTGRANVDVHSSDSTNNDSGSFAKQTFPSQLIPQNAAAHTNGDLAVFLPSNNDLIMGDLFTDGSYTVIDESAGGGRCEE